MEPLATIIILVLASVVVLASNRREPNASAAGVVGLLAHIGGIAYLMAMLLMLVRFLLK